MTNSLDPKFALSLPSVEEPISKFFVPPATSFMKNNSCGRLILISTVASIPAVALADFSDDFSSESLAAYNLYSPLSPFGAGAFYGFGPGGLTILAPQSPQPLLVGPGRGGLFVSGQTYANLNLSYTLTGNAPGTKLFAGGFVDVTTPALGTLNGYAVGIDYSVSKLFISKVVNEQSLGAIGATASSAPLNFQASDVLKVDYSNINGTQTAILTDVTSGTVLATVSGTDSTFTKGSVGLGIYLQTASAGGQGSASFGSFSATSIPEPSTWALAAIGLGALTWTSRRRLS